MGLLLVAFTAPQAHAFKARYYKDCYEPVDQVEDLVADQSDNAKNIETAGKVAGALGSFGGFGGFGGFGKAASTASKVAKYSAYVSDAMAFADQMKDDHPDPMLALLPMVTTSPKKLKTWPRLKKLLARRSFAMQNPGPLWAQMYAAKN